MFSKLVHLLLIVIWLETLNVKAEEPCGDWTAYKDEKCFQILDDISFLNFADAEQSCVRLGAGATLAIVHTAQEQIFLSGYLFQTHQSVDNFWLGAKYVNQTFQWVDGSQLTYVNWDSTRAEDNKTNHCLEIESDSRVLGKWIDEPCQKKNRVVCQKPPSWSKVELEREMIKMRKELKELQKTQEQSLEMLKNMMKEFQKFRLDSQKTIDNLNQQLKHGAEESRKTFDDFNHKIEDSKKSIESLDHRLTTNDEDIKKINDDLNHKIEDSKKSIENLDHRLTTNSDDVKKISDELSHKIGENLEIENKKIDDLKQAVIPVGFLYTQLPKEKPPNEIWPWMKWTDVSATYANVFFRVTGDQTSPFGEIQSDASPRLVQVQHEFDHYGDKGHVERFHIDLAPNGEWSELVSLGRSPNKVDNNDCSEFLKFKISKSEVRPRNMAIRIWKRTG